MFPYSLKIPRELKQFIPQLHVLIKEHDCLHGAVGKNGVTSISLHFKSEKLRNEFLEDFAAQFPAYTGLGTRLPAITPK